MREIKFEYILRRNTDGEIIKQVLMLDELQRGDCLVGGAVALIFSVVAIRQSTGLFDKNGVEIYDGDIVALETDEDDCILVVKWVDESAGFYLDKPNDCLLDNLESDYEFCLSVIGNIYENAELLNG